MEIRASGGRIKLKKEPNDLDRLVTDFVKILDRNSIKYVLVSGYVSILFGRSRSSEDIDMIVKRSRRKNLRPCGRNSRRRTFIA